MSALLALIPTKDWVYGILIIGLILLGLHEKTKFIAEGIAEQKAADDKATADDVARNVLAEHVSDDVRERGEAEHTAVGVAIVIHAPTPN